MNALAIHNHQSVTVDSIPVLTYYDFYETVGQLMQSKHNHCVNYFGVPGDDIKLYCCIANDQEGVIYLLSTLVQLKEHYPSITANYYAFHIFEREIHENFGINFTDHPWLKPVRFPYNRFNKESTIGNYPFYGIKSDELHEVGVGPIHAGVIEPGHFRFICNGEQIMHLEIQHGYQHRGLETLFLQKKNILQLATLAENIAGDTVVGHSLAFAQLWESLCGFNPSEKLRLERAIALEQERIAIHTGDLSAICTDIAYQLGSSVFGRLRTPVINFFQQWCGNRFAKGLIRPGKTNFSFTEELYGNWNKVFDAYLPDFKEMYDKLSDLPSALSRLEKTGVVSEETALTIGMVGMAARASGLSRDVRASHSSGWFDEIQHIPVIKHHGDVFSRTQMRKEEILQSEEYIRSMLDKVVKESKPESSLKNPDANQFVLSMVEGWRGEICHCAITDSKGDLIHYKIKDPSFHNWMALALAVRNNEISDFPICNKSFDLSYCGFDL
jgi:Ni,Fe-hydrogenase III large subunit